MKMKDKFLQNWRTVVLVFLAMNLLVLDVWVVKSSKSTEQEQPIIEAPVSPLLLPPVMITPIDSCGPVCQREISKKVILEVAKAVATISGQKVVEKTTVVKEVSGESGKSGISGDQAKIVYIPLVASAANSKTDWTDVAPSEFYFDLVSYPGAKTVRFTGFLRAVNATGPVYVRLYDATNKRGVDNSDFSTSNNTFDRFESAALSIWRGNNLYRLQLKSPNGTEALLSEARLKVEW